MAHLHLNRPKVSVAQFVPRVIQGSFATLKYFTSKYVNLAGLLRVLRSQVKTSGSGGLKVSSCFEEELPF